jgi:hypothetical protein
MCVCRPLGSQRNCRAAGWSLRPVVFCSADPLSRDRACELFLTCLVVGDKIITRSVEEGEKEKEA